MKVVHKYPLRIIGGTQLTLPVGAKVIHTDMQGNILTIWVEKPMPPSRIEFPDDYRTFEVFGTGADIPPHAVHVGTAIDRRNSGIAEFVWHVYEVK